MAEEDYKSPCNRLTAKELMLTRGIRAQAYEEYATSSLVLPKYGEKLFEPNGSWLQEKQINTNLGYMRDLVKIERVNRLSQLGSAEWLPNERRAIVTKRSGVEWINYGIELNKNLYLIPEEALLLMEMNCLELTWKGLSVSLQQAYDLLLDSPHSDATLQEYRVFSHLARLGYRLQRFQYDKSMTNHSEESPHPKKKVIVLPENGQWVSDEKPLEIPSEIHEKGSKIEKINNEVKETLKIMINNIEADESPNTNGNSISPDLEETKKPKITKVEIVSEEMVIDPIKIIRTSVPSEPSANQTPKWTAARIQRNVKQLPRRNDNKRKGGQISPDKRLADPSGSPQSKKIKHEVIELSDDDVQEIPRIPSRMHLLNQFPNTANNERIRITSDNIPHNVNPQKQIYQCDKRHLEVVHETDKQLRVSAKSEKSLVPYDNSRNNRYSGPSWRHNHQNGQHYLHHAPFGYNRSFRNSQYFPGGSSMHRMQQNVVINQMNSNVLGNRWSSYHQVNLFRNSMIFGYSMAATTFYNSVNFCNNMMWQAQNFFRGRRNDSRGYGRHPRGSRTLSSPRNVNHSALCQPSFTRIPASSWSELKHKWREAKTITIDDEEDRMDCSEVEVVEENIQPLVGPRHAGSIGEVFERLRIIKSAQEKTVRKKRGDYKISYKVYPNNTLHFRKASPGAPMFNIVVTSYSKQFPQPVELKRLQQDGNSSSIVFAVVSGSSTVYLQTGVIALPNLANEY